MGWTVHWRKSRPRKLDQKAIGFPFLHRRDVFISFFKKKDGSLWALDASEHRTIKSPNAYKPITPRKINFNRDIAAYAAGGDNIGIILTHDGEVWTWGRVLGQLSSKDYWSNGKPAYPESKTIDKPWQVSNIDSRNSMAK
jgi:alpha-tubulin suppressor-like RCC1 family protein